MMRWLCVFGLHQIKWGSAYEWRGKARFRSDLTFQWSEPMDISETRQPGTCERCGVARERRVN